MDGTKRTNTMATKISALKFFRSSFFGNSKDNCLYHTTKHWNWSVSVNYVVVEIQKENFHFNFNEELICRCRASIAFVLEQNLRSFTENFLKIEFPMDRFRKRFMKHPVFCFFFSIRIYSNNFYAIQNPDKFQLGIRTN